MSLDTLKRRLDKLSRRTIENGKIAVVYDLEAMHTDEQINAALLKQGVDPFNPSNSVVVVTLCDPERPGIPVDRASCDLKISITDRH